MLSLWSGIEVTNWNVVVGLIIVWCFFLPSKYALLVSAPMHSELNVTVCQTGKA